MPAPVPAIVVSAANPPNENCTTCPVWMHMQQVEAARMESEERMAVDREAILLCASVLHRERLLPRGA